MKIIDRIYINGKFVKPRGHDIIDFINPSTKEVISRVTLGNAIDTKDAIAAAKEAFKEFSKTTFKERNHILQNLHDIVKSKLDVLTQACIEECGVSKSVASEQTNLIANSFLMAKEIMEEFELENDIIKDKVALKPLGVIGVIIPSNASNALIALKVANAISAGCTMVIKPSQIRAIQTQLLTECFYEAVIPGGVINIVNGTDEVVGIELTCNPDIALID